MEGPLTSSWRLCFGKNDGGSAGGFSMLTLRKHRISAESRESTLLPPFFLFLVCAFVSCSGALCVVPSPLLCFSNCSPSLALSEDTAAAALGRLFAMTDSTEGFFLRHSVPFYDECTVCGQHQEGQPQLTCLCCRSRTHTCCAQAPMATTALYVGELGGDKLASIALSVGGSLPPLDQQEAGAASSLAAAAGGSYCGGKAGNAGGVAVSPVHRHRVASEDAFFCSADCALSVSLYQNPNFSPEISAAVEERFLRRWRAVTEGLSALPGDKPSLTEEVLEAKKEEDERADKSGAALALQAVYLQLRFDAWYQYFVLERAICASPLLLPPSHLALAEEVVEQISELVSAGGQAERLYMCDEQAGLLVALPHDAVWRGVRPIRAGETNSYLAEATQRVTATSVEPVTTVTSLFAKR